MKRERIIVLMLITAALVFPQKKPYEIFDGTEIEFTFTNTIDNTEQKAAVYLPRGIESEKPPLLMHLHYLGGDRFTAKRLMFYQAADKLKWMILSPELHGKNTTGGQTSYSSLEAQHDAIDALNTVLGKYTNIDRRRLYLAGRSMGGMLSMLLAAKYPDIFAGVCSGQGIYDLADFYRNSSLMLNEKTKAALVKEMGGTPEAVPFDYARRSSLTFARNTRTIPVVMWACSEDTVVPFSNAERMQAEVQKYNRFQAPVNWLVNASHCPANFSSEWECEKLRYVENSAETCLYRDMPWRYFKDLSIVCDESKWFYYVYMRLAKENTLGEFTTAISDASLAITAKGLKGIVIDLYYAAGNPKTTADAAKVLSSYSVAADREIAVEFVFKTQPLSKVSIKKGTGKISYGVK
ncbi:MAG: prolyl oligopeptidase family serine peptidase [Spirochaetota bacterium]